MPDWAPNPHPFLVHFPIALLVAAAAADLTSLLRPAHGTARDTATWLFCVGALTAVAAYFSGLSAAAAVRVSPDAGLAVTTHFVWADWTTWLFVCFASLRIAMSYIWRITARWAIAVSCLFSIIGLGCVAVTALHGGRLVFQYGLGVDAIPSTGAPWTLPGQAGAGTGVPEVPDESGAVARGGRRLDSGSGER